MPETAKEGGRPTSKIYWGHVKKPDKEKCDAIFENNAIKYVYDDMWHSIRKTFPMPLQCIWLECSSLK